MMRLIFVLLLPLALYAAHPEEDFRRLEGLVREAFKVEEGGDDALRRALHSWFPNGMSYDDALKKVREIRRAYRCNSEYREEVDQPEITLTIFVYFDDVDGFGKEEFDVTLAFDSSRKLQSLSRSRGSRTL